MYFAQDGDTYDSFVDVDKKVTCNVCGDGMKWVMDGDVQEAQCCGKKFLAVVTQVTIQCD